MRLYRYIVASSRYFGQNPYLDLQEYDVVKETDKGYWINLCFGIHKKWVSKDGKRRFAYPTKYQAMQNFIKRTEKRIHYLETDLYDCQVSLQSAKKIQENISEDDDVLTLHHILKLRGVSLI
jgi:hypothetical protein